jgi:monoterpene epsilon-lactone hydrolase
MEVLFLFNAGAFIMMSRKTHRVMTWRIAKYADARVLSFDYRLAPEHQYPSALIDVLSAYHYLIHTRKYLPRQITFAGDSAGASLAMACLLYIRDTGVLPMPGAAAFLSPSFDSTFSLP